MSFFSRYLDRFNLHTETSAPLGAEHRRGRRELAAPEADEWFQEEEGQEGAPIVRRGGPEEEDLHVDI